MEDRKTKSIVSTYHPSSAAQAMPSKQHQQQPRPQHHQHLIQSPYKVPVLPTLHPPEGRADGAHSKTPSGPFESHSRSQSEDFYQHTSTLTPLKQWPYVQPSVPAAPRAGTTTVSAPLPNPQATAHAVAKAATQQHPIHDPRHGSVSTADSSLATEEDDAQRKPKPLTLKDRVKARVKDLFARDEQDMAAAAARRRRRPSNPWEDEDY